MSEYQSENSIDYILRNAHSFDYGFFYHQFCDGFTREQTRKRLVSDLEICRSESGNCDFHTINWINESNCPSLVSSNIQRNQAALAIESKSILDDAVHSRQALQQENHSVQSVLINGIQAQVFSLSLVDSGLYYINIQDFDFSLHSSPLGFLDFDISKWVAQVVLFRNRCLLNVNLHTSVADSFAAELSVPSHWTRGSFLFPSKGQTASFPDDFLPSTSRQPVRNDLLIKSYMLKDGTFITEGKTLQQQENGGSTFDNRKRNIKDITLEDGALDDAAVNNDSIRKGNVGPSQSKTDENTGKRKSQRKR